MVVRTGEPHMWLVLIRCPLAWIAVLKAVTVAQHALHDMTLCDRCTELACDAPLALP